jgi:hypothetical protein
MNAMLSRMRSHRIAEIVFSLLVVALVAGTTGCVGETSSTVKYDLTIASGEGGSVSVPGEGMFRSDAGRVVDLVAVPSSGYRFDRWTGNVDTIANVNTASTTIATNGDYSITATFEETEGTYYTLTVGVTGSGSTSPTTGQHTYAAGAVISISATAAGGYHFVNWTGDVGSVANVNAASTTITMNSNYSITGNFEQTTVTYYTLTMAATGGGSVNPGAGQHSYAAGTAVSIIASPAGGYYFVNWTGSVGTIANVNIASTTITVNGDYSVTANFAALPAGQYSLTISSGAGGSVTTPGEGTFIYGSGTVVNLVAAPAGSYEFVNWSGNVGTVANVNGASTTITMNGNYEITANFYTGPPVPYNLTISSGAGGSVTTPGEGTFGYGSGTVVNLVATPASGYQFINWTGNVGTIANVNAASTTITMNSNYSITANFAPVPPGQYSLTISSTAGGSVTVPGEGTFARNAGTVVNLIAIPVGGYRLVNWTGDTGTIANVNSASTTITMNANYSISANFERVDFMVSAGDLHTVGLKSDGGVLAVGWNQYGQCNVGTWTGIVQIAAGGSYTVGVETGGTVVAAGDNSYGQCNVGTWTDIIQVAADGYHTVGLRSDGTVLATGDNGYGQCNVGTWTDIIQVAAGLYHTVGLKSNGTVVAVGDNSWWQCNVGSWTNIIQIAADGHHTMGLKSNGTVVATGNNWYGQCNVSGWTGIAQIGTDTAHTVGLKSNGTAVAVGYNYHGQCNVGGWTGIAQVTAGWEHTVGLKSNGTVIAVGGNTYGQCNVGGWDLN